MESPRGGISTSPSRQTVSNVRPVNLGRPTFAETNERSAGYPASQPRLDEGPRGWNSGPDIRTPRDRLGGFLEDPDNRTEADPRPAGRERGREFGYPARSARDSAFPFPELRSHSRLPRESDFDPVPRSRYSSQAEDLPRASLPRERDERLSFPDSRQRYPLHQGGGTAVHSPSGQ